MELEHLYIERDVPKTTAVWCRNVCQTDNMVQKEERPPVASRWHKHTRLYLTLCDKVGLQLVNNLQCQCAFVLKQFF